MEKEKTYNSQLDIEKEQSLRTNPIRFQDLLQSYSNQDTVILAKKTYRPMEQHAEPRNRPTWSTDLDRAQRQNCRERTVLSKAALEQLDIHKQKKRNLGNSLAIQWLGLCAVIAGGMGSMPGWGSKIPQTLQPSQKKNEL